MRFLFVAIMLIVNINCYATPTTLNEGLKSKTLKVLVTGNNTANNPTKSSHTGKCLKIKITNTTNQKQEINIDDANHFTNQTGSHQDLISAENYLVKLNANESKIVLINALCGEKNDGSPSETDTFILSYRHNEKMIQLTHFFEQKKLFDNTAQQAMWCMTDNNSLENIYDTHPDTTIENQLIKLVATLKGLAVPVRKITNYKHRVLRYPVELSGSHSEHIEIKTTMGVYLTDSTNIILETLYADDTETRQGTVKYSWFYRGQLTKGKYLVQLKINGVWRKLEEVIVGE